MSLPVPRGPETQRPGPAESWPIPTGAGPADHQTVILLETLLERLADGVFVLDRRDRINYWSPSAQRLTGRAARDVLGRPAEAALEGLSCELAALGEGETTGLLETPRGRLPVRVVVMKATGIGGVHLGRVCALTDLQAVWMERSQQVRLERLATLGRSLASAVHQIRNPLGAAMGFADLLERDLRGQAAHGLMLRIRDSFAEVNRRIDELLCYARPRPLHLEECELGQLVEQVRGQVQARFPGGPAAELELEPGVRAKVDPRQLRQALENIWVNACEAAGPGGAVKVLLQSGSARPPGRTVETIRLLVRNNGPALDPQVLRSMFEPFQSQKAGGTGLGLSLARSIVTSHGGELEAVSAGGWTTFVITLPAAPWFQAGEHPATRPAQETAHAAKP